MRYRTLGKTGFSVSDMGHGLWGMSGWTGSDDAQSLAAMRRSVENGCTFFDSAFAYGEGHSDALLGQIAREYADKPLILASKIPPADGKWPSSPDKPLSAVFPRAHVLKHAVMIQTAFGRPVDVLQFHVWEDAWADEAEWQDTVAELKARNIIRGFGLSLNRWQPDNGIRAIETGLIETVQVIYNIFDQAPEDHLFPACRKHNVGVIARVPLDEGSLSGKMTAETTFPAGDWRARYFKPENLHKTLEHVEALKAEISEGMSLPEMALRFILSEPTVSTIIPGMRKPAHVDANMACSDRGALPDELLASLRAHRWDRVPGQW